MFKWCVRAGREFQMVLKLASEDPKAVLDIIGGVIVSAVEVGLDRALASLELLNDSHLEVSQAKDLLHSILHDVVDDFGPSGLYGRRRGSLLASIEGEQSEIRRIGVTSLVVAIVPFVGVVSLLGILPIKACEERIQSYKNRIYNMESLHRSSKRALEEARQVVKDGIELQLDEDIRHLTVLKAKIDEAHLARTFLKSKNPDIRALFIPVLGKLRVQCQSFVEWHGSME
ncbi:uncharacterized protein Dana_GF19347 [Drosophila ananassae]|uniref:Uncharacterized protein n=1 Tax=Drosophila ananassae TaxID=7217 RepID=B3MXZ1_DROAN|nr:uncharacterized protein LOC6502107 [Drosophila ananassae]EDV38606.2 uncharacterized protein Dana_GF19347 [Drosophila ananassae]